MSDDGIYVCRQCHEVYCPNPNAAAGTDDGFCSDPCEHQYDVELGIREPMVPRGNFTLAEVKEILKQARDSVLENVDLKFDDPPMLAIEKYIEEAEALFGMQHDTETSDNV